MEGGDSLADRHGMSRRKVKKIQGNEDLAVYFEMIQLFMCHSIKDWLKASRFDWILLKEHTGFTIFTDQDDFLRFDAPNDVNRVWFSIYELSPRSQVKHRLSPFEREVYTDWHHFTREILPGQGMVMGKKDLTLGSLSLSMIRAEVPQAIKQAGRPKGGLERTLNLSKLNLTVLPAALWIRAGRMAKEVPGERFPRSPKSKPTTPPTILV